ncbi:MAG: hypothetical protein ACR2N3_00095 [Pyrinomonadaceae bacterium]
MNILLKSRSDIVSWGAVFRILGYELCIPIWKIIDISEKIIDNPKPILDIAKIFFKGSASIWSPKIMTTDEEVSNHFEAQRMLDLGLLYDCFGRIVNSYEEETAIQLYEWGDRYFIHEKLVFWWNWNNIFSKLMRNQTSLVTSLNQNDSEQILGIIKNQFEQEAYRKEKLDVEFERLCQEFSTNPEQINLLNKVSISDVTIFNNFDDVDDELSNIFNFEGILYLDCAYKIWQRINANFEIEVRENLFQWGIKELKNSGLGINRRLKDYCLCVGISQDKRI